MRSVSPGDGDCAERHRRFQPDRLADSSRWSERSIDHRKVDSIHPRPEWAQEFLGPFQGPESFQSRSGGLRGAPTTGYYLRALQAEIRSSLSHSLDGAWVRVEFIKPLFAILIIVASLTGCGLFSRRVKLGEEFTMKPKEKVVVAGAGLEIRLEGVGHQTFPEPQPRQARSSYVTLRVNPGPSRSIEVSDSVDVGDYTITVKSADPFASGGPLCKLVVTRR